MRNPYLKVNEKKKLRTLWMVELAIAFGLIASNVLAQPSQKNGDPLKFLFNGKRGQVEVGGPYAGFEFHNSRPVPSRISFYYPVANSIDLSKDYWKRGESLPMVVGLRMGGGVPEWIQKESWSYVLSPHRVTFVKTTDSVAWSIAYEFCKNEPAAVVSMCLKNLLKKPLSVELYTHLVMSLRTCQTYSRKDTCLMMVDRDTRDVIARFNYRDTDSAAVFVQSVGEIPVEWTTDAREVGATDNGGSRWGTEKSSLSSRIMAIPEQQRGIAAFVYRKVLAPGDSINIVQTIGSCRTEEIANKEIALRTSWQKEVHKYNQFILSKAEDESSFSTGDRILDRSARWAKGLIAANAHYLDGRIVPMPCPAEYNFFFTHDLLLTNLGAVNFDLERVKSNLLYVVSMAKDSVIPHAYYWRDDGFKTEYCEPENWNHLWFVIVSGSYLRHSLDDSTGDVIYPFLTKSVNALLTRLKSDGLMYAYRPDWWDIGHVEGPRAYLTALAIRALREYLFISSYLHRQNGDLLRFERIADKMQKALTEKLWDKSDEYLTNYNAGKKDEHFYAGSLIASVYELLDQENSKEMVSTATRQLVDERIGIRIAMPPNFSTDSVIQKFKFAGDEAGPPYSYANGGVWPHGNAWYAMSLKNVGKLNEACDFVKRTMTIDGIAESPNGVPAMYEYRSSDPRSPSFGTIDKPSFLWAGGMYLQVLYRLLAIDENVWNIGIRNRLPSQCDSVSCTMTFGGMKQLNIRRSSDEPGPLKVDGMFVPSRILPIDQRSKRTWESSRDHDSGPILIEANAIVYAVAYTNENHSISCDVSSFEGHTTTMKFVGTGLPKQFTVNGRPEHELTTRRVAKGLYETTIAFPGSAKRQSVILIF